eukprot:3409244-Prymnesium_polylepis.3
MKGARCTVHGEQSRMEGAWCTAHERFRSWAHTFAGRADQAEGVRLGRRLSAHRHDARIGSARPRWQAAPRCQLGARRKRPRREKRNSRFEITRPRYDSEMNSQNMSRFEPPSGKASRFEITRPRYTVR